MIFSRDLLFLHAPKTGGMSVTEYLLDVLPGPVHYTDPAPGPAPEDAREDVVHRPGIRHEDLEQAIPVLRDAGFVLDDFPAILVVLRNPYALEVSRYAYLRAGHPWDFGHDQTLALTRDCGTFVRNARNGPDLARYFFLDRTVPENLRVLRFERLVEDLPRLLSELGIEPNRELPHRNRSRHGHYRSYYDRASEEAVYRRHRWLFDLAFYERMEIDAASTGTEEDTSALTLPLVGPVGQVGEATGFWPDLWAAPVVNAVLEARADIDHIELLGQVPAGAKDPVDLEILVDGRPAGRTTAPRGESVRWRVPVHRPAGATFRLELRSSGGWSPSREGSSDERELGLQLIRIFCRAEPRRAAS